VLDPKLRAEVHSIIKPLATHLQGNDKGKALKVLYQRIPKEKAGKEKGKGKGKTPPPSYDIIEMPETLEEVAHNKEAVAYLLREGVFPFVHEVDMVCLPFLVISQNY